MPKPFISGKRAVRLLLALLAAAVLVGGSACARYQVEKVGPQNLLFRLTSGIVEFSFEYSPLYRVAEVSLHDGHTQVVLENQSAALSGETRIAVWTAELKPGQKSYQRTLESELASLSLRDFSLLSQATRSLDGEKAGEVVFSYTREQSTAGVSVATIPSTVRWLMFARDGFLWWIRVDSPASQTASARADYDQVVQTFQPLG